MKSALAPAVLAAILVSAACAIASDDDNRLGLYYDASATIDEIEISPNSQQVLYLVLLDPVNDDYDGGGSRDVSYVSGFECAIVPPTGDFVVGVDFPQSAVNLGSADNVVVGFAEGVPVTSTRSAMLATFSVLSLGNNSAGYHLSPASPSTFDGAMAYVDAEDPEDNLVRMMPASGDFASAVFWFGDWHVEEDRQWGKVKALFR